MSSTAGTFRTALVVADPDGLHLRPAAEIVKIATQFDSDVHVEYDGKRADGKSLLSICMLAAQAGARLTISAIGRDACNAIRAIEAGICRLFEGDSASTADGDTAASAFTADTPIPVKAEPRAGVFADSPALTAEAAASRNWTFTWSPRGAEKTVCLAGDFNRWIPTPMTRRKNRFELRIDLLPGAHEYKFVVDGEWKADPAAAETVPNAFGSANSVIRIP